MSSVNKATGYTLIDREDYDFTWIIENVQFLPFKQGELLVSPIFSTKCDVKFYFRLIDELQRGLDSSSLVRNLYLHYKNAVNEFKCDYDAYVTVDRRKVMPICGSAIIEVNKDIAIMLVNGYHSSILHSTAETITVDCNLKLSRGNVTSFLNSGPIVNDATATIPKLKFDWVFLDKNLSDVKLQTASGKDIPTHRVVLAAASPVFKAMFSHDMLENKSQSVNMTDIGYETAVEMLRFIYTGSVEKEEVSFIIDLLMAADKYQLEELQRKCEEILSRNLSTKNAIDILKIADKCSMKNLKKNAINFMKLHIHRSPDSDDVGDMLLGMERFFSK
ncbi:protein roadkill-like [Trichogramma pretiosum]|uniref:protein roadkill-like n=1 Tax=Trichogramma pretiosum TaxID=7493 RepID=UPI0006C9BD20|nr:protein roadkill-like [Trichogramma pretiosum]